MIRSFPKTVDSEAKQTDRVWLLRVCNKRTDCGFILNKKEWERQHSYQIFHLRSRLLGSGTNRTHCTLEG